MSAQDIIVYFACLIVGAFFGAWKRPRDRWSFALGIACGVSVAFAYVVKDAWYLLALLLFVPLVIWRRRATSPKP